MNIFFVLAIALLIGIPACGGKKKKQVSKVETVKTVEQSTSPGSLDTKHPASKF